MTGTNILVLAEHDGVALKSSTLNTVTAATEIAKLTGGQVHFAILGQNGRKIAEEAAKAEGVKTVIHMDSKELAHGVAESTARALHQIAGDYSHILAPASTFGKNVLPRLAAQLDVMQVSEVIKIHTADTFDRPIYAGNAIMTVQSLDPIKIMTVRPTAFAPARLTGSAEIQEISFSGQAERSSFVGLEASKSERPELTSAKIVVSGGRALASKENFKIIEDLADCLKAAIGASRAAVDAGYVPNDYQVGQTGKVVAPELYIAVGISGAIQHLAGMKDSKTIIAINKDADAPIFQIADYGLVGDLFEIVPQITKELCP